MKLELKSIKYAAFASQETSCYDAVVYLDGKPFATVSNDGHGGSDYQNPTDRWLRANLPECDFGKELKRVNAFLASTKPIESGKRPDGSTWEYKHDLEAWCGEQITKWQVTKDLKRLLRKIAIIKPDGLYTLNAKPTEQNLARYARENPKVKVLNLMSFDKALTTYAAQCGVSL